MEGKISVYAQKVLHHGVCELAKNQLSFGKEFGLAGEQMFSHLSYDALTPEFSRQIAKWMCSGEKGAKKLEKLFSAFCDHELALLAAFDGVVLKTLDALESQEFSPGDWYNRINAVKESTTNIRDLKESQQLRYQNLIAPGFVNAYLNSRSINTKGSREIC